MKKKYGYKVCYKEYGKIRYKVHLVCNTYEGALWNVQYYQNHKQQDRKTKIFLIRPKWKVFPIRTFFEYKKLWHGCPF